MGFLLFFTFKKSNGTYLSCPLLLSGSILHALVVSNDDQPVCIPASMVLDDVAVSPVAPLSGDTVGVFSSLVIFAGGAFVLSSTVSTFLFGDIFWVMLH